MTSQSRTTHYERRDNGFYAVWGADFEGDDEGEQKLGASTSQELRKLDEATQQSYLDLRTRPTYLSMDSMGKHKTCGKYVRPMSELNGTPKETWHVCAGPVALPPEETDAEICERLGYVPKTSERRAAAHSAMGWDWPQREPDLSNGPKEVSGKEGSRRPNCYHTTVENWLTGVCPHCGEDPDQREWDYLDDIPADQVPDAAYLTEDDDSDPCSIRDCPEEVWWVAGPFCGKHDKAVRQLRDSEMAQLQEQRKIEGQQYWEQGLVEGMETNDETVAILQKPLEALNQHGSDVSMEWHFKLEKMEQERDAALEQVDIWEVTVSDLTNRTTKAEEQVQALQRLYPELQEALAILVPEPPIGDPVKARIERAMRAFHAAITQHGAGEQG